MPRASVPRRRFDALILDLDGTLVSSSRMFHGAANQALQRLALSRKGAFVPLPAEATDVLLGLPWRELIAGLAPDADLHERERLAIWLHEAESALLATEMVPEMLFPGVLEALDAERARGARLAVASNCQDFYLTAVMRGTGLGERIELPLCLSIPGIHSKSDMVARALAHFGTRSAAMIGDRVHDRAAAEANGIAFLRFAGASYGALDGIEDAPSFARWQELAPALHRLSRS